MGAKFKVTRTLVSAAAILLFGVTAGAGAQPAPLTTLRAVSQLTNDQASQHPRVAFEATVIYFFGPGRDLNVQDGDAAIYVEAPENVDLAPGDRVLVQGSAEPSFLPYVVGDSIAVLSHGPLPKPLPATFDDLVSTRVNCRLVSVRGVVRTADLASTTHTPDGRLQLLMDGGYVDLHVNSRDSAALAQLMDSEVEVTGAAGRIFDGKMQQVGVKIKVQSLGDIKVFKRAGASPWSLPVTPLAGIISAFYVRDLTSRLRVHGTITYYQPGSAVVLESGAGSLWVSTQTIAPMQVGDVADATGFPEVHDGQLVLAHAEIQDSGVRSPISPLRATWSQLATWGRNTRAGHEYDLVSIEGRVVTEVREAVRDEYVLVSSDGRLFNAVYRHPPSPSALPPMLAAGQDATIRVTGICLMAVAATPSNGEAPFDILLRSFDDVTVVSQAPWLNVRHLMELAASLLFIVLMVGIRGWYLDYKNHRQVVSLAYLEQRRSRILEDINHSKPLAGILERITELVSMRLDGAACWCQVADGATLGNCPQRLAATALRTVEHPIEARSGPPLGTIFASFAANTVARAEETEALSMGAGLATLAIETSRLHSDLVHRSEFDLLTDVQNRFAMEKALDAMIRTARNSAGIFALIYIDLNEFKQVNDEYGHRAGDLYLQAVTQRMKRQLRPSDTLARLGGDEFAVLVPEVRNRAEVEEIAARLESCFEEPFIGEGYAVHGSASVGLAIYPEDANSADTLLSAADAAMYVSKYTRSGRTRSSESRLHSEMAAGKIQIGR